MLFRRLVLATWLIAVTSGSRCPRGDIEDDMYFDINIKLSAVKGNCNEEDMNKIGDFIDDMVRDVERNITMQQERGEDFRADMCRDAKNETGQVLRKLLRADERHRRLGLYSYRGGGFCRRCIPDTSDRMLRELKRFLHGEQRLLSEEPTVEVICGYAQRAAKAMLNSEVVTGQAFNVLTDIKELALDLMDESKAKELVNKAMDKHVECEQERDLAVLAAGLAADLCDDAKVTTVEGELKDCLEDIKKTSDKATVAAEKSNHLLNLMKDLKAEVERLLSEQPSMEVICSHAQIADEASKLAAYDEKDALAARNNIKNIAPLLEDESKTNDFIEKAVKKHLECEQAKDLAIVAAGLADDICDKAQETTVEDELKACLADVKQISNKAVDAAKNAEDLFYKVVDLQVDLKKKIFDNAYAIRKAEIELATKEMDDITAKLISEKKNDYEDLARRVKELNGAEKDLAKLKMREMEDEMKKLKKANDATGDFMIKEAKWNNEVSKTIVEAEGAQTDSDWLKVFRDLLELYLPHQLMVEYSVFGDGCLESKPTVKVETVELGDNSDNKFIKREECDIYLGSS